MKLKPEVKEDGVAKEVWYALGVLQACMYAYGAGGHELVVTALTDGKHKEGSLHYKGLAADVRSKDVPHAEEVAAVANRILNAQGFDLLFESKGLPSEHFHLEFDPKKGEAFFGRL
jgi:hypothetical protein